MTISLYDQEQADQDLLSYFDKSASVVRGSFKHFEQQYARPAFEFSVERFQEQPVLSIFLGVFTAFSIVPVISFIGFSLFVLASCLLFGLIGALFVATAIIVSSGLLLVGMLIIFSFISLFLTGCAMGVYLSLRFAVLVNKDGPRAGVPEWVQETRQSFLRTRHENTHAQEPKAEEDASSGSEALIIDGEPIAPSAQAEADGPEGGVSEPDAVKDMVVVTKEEE